MFKLGYNFLAGLQVVVGIANTFVIVYALGISNKADAYLLAMSITQATGLLTVLFVEQVVIFYAEAQEKNKELASLFAGNAITIAILAGGIFAISLVLLPSTWTHLFASSAGAETISFTDKMLPILAVAVFCQSICVVLNGLLNVHKIYAWPYITSIIPSVTTLVGIFALVQYKKYDPLGLAAPFSAGVTIQLLLLTILLKKNHITLRWTGLHPDTVHFVKNSFTMRLAHNFHQFFSLLIINTFLSGFAQGSIALFQYARRAVSAVSMIATGPINNIYTSEIAEKLSLKDGQGIIRNKKKYHLAVLPLFLIGSLILIPLLPYVIRLVVQHQVSEDDLELLRWLSTALVIWNFIIAAETPYVTITVAAKRSYTLMMVNATFMLTFWMLSRFLTARLGAVGLPAAGAIAQIISILVFAYLSRKILTDLEIKNALI